MSKFPAKERALGMYRKMYEIRKYEESIYYLFLEGISILIFTGRETESRRNSGVALCWIRWKPGGKRAMLFPLKY